MAFTGKAVYSTGVWGYENVEDVSPIISNISPLETPVLDALGDAAEPATDVIHYWMEDKNTPNTFVSSTTIPASTTTTTIQVAGSLQPHIDIGAIVFNETAGEYLRVSATASNYLTLVRAQGGTSAASVGAGSTFQIMDGAATEQEDYDLDTSRTRTRGSNIVQLIKKDILVSGTMQAIKKYGVTNEFDYQGEARLREAIRDLEKFVIKGKGTSSVTLGSSSEPRMMHGLTSKITTNVTTVTTLTDANVRAALRSAWDNGGRIDLILCDNLYKEIIDDLNEGRVRVENSDGIYRNYVEMYGGTYGQQRVIMSPWMPTASMLLIDSSRVKVVPLIDRSFALHGPIEGAYDGIKGAVKGEYTVEVRNEEGMAYIYEP